MLPSTTGRAKESDYSLDAAALGSCIPAQEPQFADHAPEAGCFDLPPADDDAWPLEGCCFLLVGFAGDTAAEAEAQQIIVRCGGKRVPFYAECVTHVIVNGTLSAGTPLGCVCGVQSRCTCAKIASRGLAGSQYPRAPGAALGLVRPLWQCASAQLQGLGGSRGPLPGVGGFVDRLLIECKGAVQWLWVPSHCQRRRQ